MRELIVTMLLLLGTSIPQSAGDVKDSNELLTGKWSKTMTINYLNPAGPDTVKYDEYSEMTFVSDGVWNQFLKMENTTKHLEWKYWVVGDSLFRSFDGVTGWHAYNIERKNDTLILYNDNIRHINVSYSGEQLPENWADLITHVNMDSLKNKIKI